MFIPTLFYNRRRMTLPALSDYLGGNGLIGLKFLLPQIKGAGSELARALADAGAVVTELPVYQRAAAAKGDLPKLKALLAGGAIDEFVFCAPDDVDNLLYICETVDIQALLSGMKVIAANETGRCPARWFGPSNF